MLRHFVSTALPPTGAGSISPAVLYDLETGLVTVTVTNVNINLNSANPQVFFRLNEP